MAVINSPFLRLVEPGPDGISSTRTSFVPDEFKIETDAPAAIIPGTLSAAGDPLHKLPTKVALLWI